LVGGTAVTAALPFRATLADLEAVAAKTIVLQRAAQALPVKGMLAAGMAVLLIAHILLVAVEAQAQQAGLQQVIQWLEAAVWGCLPQLPDQRYFMLVVAVGGYIFLAELLALAGAGAGELARQILPLGVPEQQIRAVAAAGLGVVLQAEQEVLALLFFLFQQQTIPAPRLARQP
jgi:hypothetical protein